MSTLSRSSHAEINEETLQKSIKAFDNGDYRTVQKLLAKSSWPVSIILTARASELINSDDAFNFMRLVEFKNDESANCWVAHAFINAREYKKAEELLTRQISKQRASALPHIMLADCYAKSQRPLEATKEFVLARSLDPRSEILFELFSDFYLKSLQIPKALELLDNWSQLHPKMVRSYVKAAIIYNELGQQDRADSQCQMALKLNSKYQLAYYVLAKVAFSRNNSMQAIESCRKCISIDENSDAARSARKLLVQYFEQQANYALEIEQLNPLLQGRHKQLYGLTGDQIEYLLKRGQAYLSTGKTNEAILDANEVLKVKPNRSSAHLLRARALRIAGHYSESYADYQFLSVEGLAKSILDEKNSVRLEMQKRAGGVGKP